MSSPPHLVGRGTAHSVVEGLSKSHRRLHDLKNPSVTALKPRRAVSPLCREKTELHHTIGGGPASTSRLPAWLAGLTTPSCSIRSIREAARL